MPGGAELLITVLDTDVHKEGGGGVRVSVLGEKMNVTVTWEQRHRQKVPFSPVGKISANICQDLAKLRPVSEHCALSAPKNRGVREASL